MASSLLRTRSPDSLSPRDTQRASIPFRPPLLRRCARAAAVLLPGLALYLLARPLLALLHELLILAISDLQHVLARAGAAATLSGHVPFDPVYTSTMFLLLSDVQVAGVAVAAPAGDLLHALWPTVFAAPALLADGAWASAVIEPGASVIARGIATLSADIAYLALGLLIIEAAPAALRWCGRWPRWPGWLTVFGALLQAHIVVNHLIDEPISLTDLEAAGVTYGFSVLFDGPSAERPRLSALLLALPEPVRYGVLAALTVLLAYAGAGAVLLVIRGLWRGARWLASRLTASRPRQRRPGTELVPRTGLALFALAVVASPLGAIAEASPRYQQHAEAPAAELLAEPPPTPTVSVPPPIATPPASGPTVVTVSGANYSYVYRVNGRRQVIRGMGYNPTYAQLPAEERARRYERDFGMMRRAGVNTVLGWVTEEFDGLLLDKAQEQGLGVIMPYHLDPELDYTDPAVRDRVARNVLDWVQRYRNHPAVRMWGLGNEVLHKLVYPSWLRLRGDPVLEARADAFAAFYVDLIDRVHQLDPNHPVVYREAEDAYLPRMREALSRGEVRRPWFVYGINIYTPRLAEVIAAWPTQGLDAALLISEFAPGGAGPADRPRGYHEMWEMIRARPERVLGGAPYVWTTNGPEEVDRVFGLVDQYGKPVDGSLAAIGRLFRGEAARDGEAPTTDAGARSCDEQVSSLARRTLRELQQRGGQTVFQARTPPSIMGPLDNIPGDALRAEDLRFELVEEPARVAWMRTVGYDAEWWVTWRPPSQPQDEVALLVRDRDGELEIAYVYHGPGGSSRRGWSC